MPPAVAASIAQRGKHAPDSLVDRRPAARRSGFTLLELILALSFTAVVLAIVSTAVSIHLRVLDRGRVEVEEAQLARALLHRVADDLRRAVPGSPSSGGFFGTASALQLEIRCATHPGRATSPQDIQPSAARLSDNRRVIYYVVQPDLDATEEDGDRPAGALPDRSNGDDAGRGQGGLDPAMLAASLGQDQRGLIRCERDEATAVWAEQQGEIPGRDWNAQVLAPEVQTIEFSYHGDSAALGVGGSAGEWDSQLTGTLPSAVKIAVTLHCVPRGPRSLLGEILAEDRAPTVYSLLVHLPGSSLPAQTQPSGSPSQPQSPEGQSPSKSPGPQNQPQPPKPQP